MSDNQKLQIYSDGGARGNPGPAAIGVLICDDSGNPVKEYKQTIGEATNNVAEYSAVIEGLKLAKELGGCEVDYYMDSELVARQLTGQYRVKTPHILELFRKVKEQEQGFQKISFNHVPRTHQKIRRADQLVNMALDEAGH